MKLNTESAVNPKHSEIEAPLGSLLEGHHTLKSAHQMSIFLFPQVCLCHIYMC